MGAPLCLYTSRRRYCRILRWRNAMVLAWRIERSVALAVIEKTVLGRNAVVIDADDPIAGSTNDVVHAANRRIKVSVTRAVPQKTMHSAANKIVADYLIARKSLRKCLCAARCIKRSVARTVIQETADFPAAIGIGPDDLLSGKLRKRTSWYCQADRV